MPVIYLQICFYVLTSAEGVTGLMYFSVPAVHGVSVSLQHSGGPTL